MLIKQKTQAHRNLCFQSLERAAEGVAGVCWWHQGAAALSTEPPGQALPGRPANRSGRRSATGCSHLPEGAIGSKGIMLSVCYELWSMFESAPAIMLQWSLRADVLAEDDAAQAVMSYWIRMINSSMQAW